MEFKKSDMYLIVIIIIMITTYILLKLFTFKSTPLLKDYANKTSTNLITSIINNSIKEVLHNKNYNNIIKLDKDKNENITNLNLDNEKVNTILYEITNNILENISKMQKNNELIIKVPIGIIHDIPVITNIGPKIPFKIEMIGDINSNTKTNVKDYGINNSLIEIVLNINMQIQVILPFTSDNLEISKDIVLDSRIIQGNIPDYYGGLINNKNS